MLTSQRVKDAALAAGADLCGIGDMNRFEGAPPEMDPRYIFPEAKTKRYQSSPSSGTPRSPRSKKSAKSSWRDPPPKKPCAKS